MTTRVQGLAVSERANAGVVVGWSASANLRMKILYRCACGCECVCECKCQCGSVGKIGSVRIKMNAMKAAF